MTPGHVPPAEETLGLDLHQCFRGFSTVTRSKIRWRHGIIKLFKHKKKDVEYHDQILTLILALAFQTPCSAIISQLCSTSTAGGSKPTLTISACIRHHLGGRLAHDMDHIQRAVDGVGDGDGSLGGLGLHLLWPTQLMALGPCDAHRQHLLSPLWSPSGDGDNKGA